ncbi:hypothetical protein AB1Y20_009810 [Prymnesium parvum]|uniref:Lipoyl-binding domain-containing protein n=1 Tax=Prymnesium parvum TaxID=97485 RepID=A0AB34K2P0_PRYPA
MSSLHSVANCHISNLMLSARVARRVGRLPFAENAFTNCRTFRATALRAGTLDTPFISDTVPLAEGVLGTVEELHLKPGDDVKEMDVIAVVETDKVSLDVRANRSGRVDAILVEIGDTVKERQPLYSLVDGTASNPL